MSVSKTIIDDSDLPAIFWPDGSAPKCETKNSELSREVAIQVHYPVFVKSQKRETQERRALDRDRKESVLAEQKSFVRLGKKQQMFDWLIALENTFPGMDERERDFCRKLLDRFRKYGIVKTKWITKKQYDWLKFISTRYICLPNRES